MCLGRHKSVSCSLNPHLQPPSAESAVFIQHVLPEEEYPQLGCHFWSVISGFPDAILSCPLSLSPYRCWDVMFSLLNVCWKTNIHTIHNILRWGEGWIAGDWTRAMCMWYPLLRHLPSSGKEGSSMNDGKYASRAWEVAKWEQWRSCVLCSALQANRHWKLLASANLSGPLLHILLGYPVDAVSNVGILFSPGSCFPE